MIVKKQRRRSLIDRHLGTRRQERVMGNAAEILIVSLPEPLLVDGECPNRGKKSPVRQMRQSDASSKPQFTINVTAGLQDFA
jgi:hypothetical protein